MKEIPNYYSVIPAEVRYDENLRDKSKLLYGEISSLCNKYGYCYASNQYFADLYKVSKTTISILIKELVDNEYIISEIEYKEGTKEILNRYLRIVKGGYLRNLKGGIKENLKDNNTSINNTRDNNKYNNIYNQNQDFESEFEDIWKDYPRKQGKQNALKSYIKARKKGISQQQMLEGLNNYLKYIKIERVNPKYIKQGSTWFNQECWNDDYSINREITTKDLAEYMDFSDF